MEDNERKAPRAGNIIIAAIFIVFVIGGAAALLIGKDRAFSEMENRPLAQRPELSFKSVKEGKYSEALEEYISDQLPFKDSLVSLKTDIDRALGKSYQNGVYMIKDSSGKLRYIQKYSEDKAQIEVNVGKLRSFAEKLDIPVDLLLIPNASAFALDKLPAGAVCDDQKESIKYVGGLIGNKINYYPMDDVLSNKLDCYFLTDHHWTAEGAKAAADDYLRRSGQMADGETLAAYSGADPKDFYGTLYSKAPSGFASPDKFTYDEKLCGAVETEWVNEGKKSDSMLDRSFLEKKDKYAVYFGGNFAQIRIRTGNPGERVLVLKDSYANSAMQFLAQKYSEITMIDLRYYHMQELSVSELCSELGCDRVIMLYNMDFLNEDRNFVWLE